MCLEVLDADVGCLLMSLMPFEDCFVDIDVLVDF